VAEDHEDPELLFVGSEFGVFFTHNGGRDWVPLKSGLPTIAVRDLEIQRREHDLVVGTFGRGFYILDDYSPLRLLASDLLDKPAAILPIKTAQAYVQTAPLAGGEKAFQGANFYTAPNPPFGATFTYYLKDSLKTKRDQRREEEKKLARENRDVAYPSWKALKAEDREEPPEMVITIYDSDSNVVRRLAAATSRGLHRATWDLRHAGFRPRQLSGDSWGPMAIPGEYTVSLTRRTEEGTEELVPPTQFDVVPLGFQALSSADQKKVLEFQKQTGALQRAVLGAYEVARQAAEHIRYVKKNVELSPSLDLELRDEARALELQLQDITEQFAGDPTRPRRNEPAPPGILNRVQTIVGGHWSNTIGPTNTHRRNFEIASDEFGEVVVPLRKLVERDLPKLQAKLERAGAPWAPGRRIPDWPRSD
jgi:hypothetical protein